VDNHIEPGTPFGVRRFYAAFFRIYRDLASMWHSEDAIKLPLKYSLVDPRWGTR
jgi:hypothetical protein